MIARARRTRLRPRNELVIERKTRVALKWNSNLRGVIVEPGEQQTGVKLDGKTGVHYFINEELRGDDDDDDS